MEQQRKSTHGQYSNKAEPEGITAGEGEGKTGGKVEAVKEGSDALGSGL